MIARQVRKSSLWLSLKCAHRMVMMEILLQAQWQDNEVVRNGEIIPLKRGQVATSYQQLVDDIADKDVTVKIVRTAIDKMERSQFLAKDEAVQRAKKGLLLTVVKYDFFQSPDNYKGRVEDKEEGKAKAEQGQSEGRARAINNKGNKVEELKNLYLEYIYLSEKEHSNLTEKLGENVLEDLMQELNVYLANNPKKRKDTNCNLTLQNWHRRNQKKKLTPIISQTGTSIPPTAKKIKEVPFYDGPDS